MVKDGTLSLSQGERHFCVPDEVQITDIFRVRHDCRFAKIRCLIYIYSPFISSPFIYVLSELKVKNFTRL
jgi:hypothetical protein